MKRILLLLTLLLVGAASAQAERIYVMNAADTQIFYGSFQFALENSPIYQKTTWSNPDTGLNGSTIPVQSYRLPTGQICRDYLSQVAIGDINQQTYGTACRQADGNWKVVGDRPVQNYASVSSPADKGTPEAGCPGMMQEQGRQYLEVQLSGRFSDPYLAYIHRFTLRVSPEGYYHNWQIDPHANMGTGHGSRFHHWVHPPINPQQPEQRQPSKLVKLVDANSDY